MGDEPVKKIYRLIQGKTGAYALILAASIVAGCAGGSKHPLLEGSEGAAMSLPDYYYVIGPGDNVSMFVWGNPEVSQSVPVRPDGKITAPLVEDLQASGKTPTQLARDVEKVLSKYIKEPIVTVIVTGFVGPYTEQVRVIGEAAQPQALSYRENMTILDVMIAVGGLTEFAAGNQASIVRMEEGKQQQYGVRLEDLIKDGDIAANVAMRPGDILIIPESWF